MPVPTAGNAIVFKFCSAAMRRQCAVERRSAGAVVWPPPASGGDNLDNFDVAFTDRLTLGGSPAFARVHTSAMPPPRDHASLIVDGGHRRLVLLGGGSLGDGLGLRGDAWIYPLGACP